MIVIAIIGVLAGIAIPAYTNYTYGSQVARVHSELTNYSRAAETAIAINTIHMISTDPSGIVGFTDSDISTTRFGTFADAANSTIEATMDGFTGSGIRGTVVTLTRSGSGIWTCSIVGSGLGFEESFKPQDCT